MADLLRMSEAIIDGTMDAAGVGPVNRINHQLSEIGDGVAHACRTTARDGSLTCQLDGARVAVRPGRGADHVDALAERWAMSVNRRARRNA